MKSRLKFTILLLVALALSPLLAAKAGMILDGTTVPASSPISLSTVQIQIRKNLAGSPGQSDLSYCTGSLIEPDIVLTAAHCLNGTLTVIPVDVRPKEERKWYQAPPRYAIQAVRAHPNYNFKNDLKFLRETNAPEDFDLAILKLDREVSAEHSPAPILPASEPLLYPTTVVAAGYGTNDTFGTMRGAGVLRQSEIQVVQELPSRHIVVRGEKSSGICSGDSGGPVFLPSSDGRPRLWGVISMVTEACRGYGLIIRMTHHSDWIQSTIRELRAETASKP